MISRAESWQLPVRWLAAAAVLFAIVLVTGTTGAGPGRSEKILGQLIAQTGERQAATLPEHTRIVRQAARPSLSERSKSPQPTLVALVSPVPRAPQGSICGHCDPPQQLSVGFLQMRTQDPRAPPAFEISEQQRAA